ncbi:MAG TPA: radical SAM protein [Polyangiales bacterium]|nr:radical SAM protein [Polyangiales bacterium]
MSEATSLIHAGSGRWNERWLVELRDGSRVECVLYRGDTLCVSSQVGCAVRCAFCASGREGLGRGLSPDELIGQLEAVRALGHAPARVTVSGVGEPLHNHAAVCEFLSYCRSQRLALSLTSSGGPLPRLREWLHAPHNGLTLSIHAGSEACRSRLLPHAPPLAALFEVLREELPRMTQRRRRKTALAYLLMAGENDAPEELDEFCARAVPLGLRVHLYDYNQLPEGGFRGASRERYEAVYAQLSAAGLRVSMSSQARLESNGGCGTLVALRSTPLAAADRGDVARHPAREPAAGAGPAR